MTNPEPIVLDVRPLLANGEEPFHAIMQTVSGLLPGQALLLRAPFEPRPLYQILCGRGYEADPRPLEGGDWEILFRPASTEAASAEREVDLRALEPPGPLQQALAEISSLGREETLVVLTRFRPIHLLEQLDDLGYEGESEEKEEGHWETRIWRVPPV